MIQSFSVRMMFYVNAATTPKFKKLHKLCLIILSFIVPHMKSVVLKIVLDNFEENE